MSVSPPLSVSSPLPLKVGELGGGGNQEGAASGKGSAWKKPWSTQETAHFACLTWSIQEVKIQTRMCPYHENSVPASISNFHTAG